MTKGERDRMDLLEKDVLRLSARVEKFTDENRDLAEELNHYRTAMSAVRWLWDQAQKGREFHV